MTIHQLKSWPEYFEPVSRDIKRFELRRNDRNFMEGDYVVLREWDPNTRQYSGRELTRRIIYIMRGIGTVGTIAPAKGLSVGFAILGLEEAP